MKTEVHKDVDGEGTADIIVSHDNGIDAWRISVRLDGTLLVSSGWGVNKEPKAQSYLAINGATSVLKHVHVV